MITCVHLPRTRAELEELLKCFDSGDFSPVIRKRERELEIYYILGLFLWEGKIPVFSGIQHDLFTRLFVFILGFGIRVSIMVLFGIILAKYYIGNLTRRAVDALVWGRAVSLTFKGILVFGVTYVALLFWTPENVWWVAEHIWIGSPETFYHKAMGMKHPVWMSGWMQLLTSPILSVIPFGCLKAQEKRLTNQAT